MKLFLFGFIYFPILLTAQYRGTASISKGMGVKTISNLLNCNGGRISAVGKISSLDTVEWIMPAETNYTNSSFPKSFDLYNSCVGANYKNTTEAVSKLQDSDIVIIDSEGEIITGFLFADNYFECYVNGNPVGKDNVPYTQFNSSIIRFKVKRPFVISFLLVDWEENLGVGTESNGGFLHHAGDGGLVAIFKNERQEIIAITDKQWKAQVFYAAPIKDLNCPTEKGELRLTDLCNTEDSNDGSAYYGLHWHRPNDVFESKFNDTNWPNADEYSNTEVGVNNKPAYTNFQDLFDDKQFDAKFIWSSNLVLDNEVIVRYRVPELTSLAYNTQKLPVVNIYPNYILDKLHISVPEYVNQEEIKEIVIFDAVGRKVSVNHSYIEEIDFSNIPPGIYTICLQYNNQLICQKIIHE